MGFQTTFRTLVVLLMSAVTGVCTQSATARKNGYNLRIEKNSKNSTDQESMARGSFMVASQCLDCNNGYRLSQIEFHGYDKPQTGSTETFFITNNTDRTMSGITLYIEYLSSEKKQIHKRYVKLSCNIPPGETRRADIESWDKQKSFYYEHSRPSRNGGAPYSVIFDPVAFYLRF